MSMTSFSLEGRVALITGARRGLGKAFALAMAEAGADVTVADYVLETGELEAVAEEIRKMGRNSIAVQADVTRKDDVDNLVAKAIEKFGVIDILLNNASKFGEIRMKPWDSLTVEEWKELLSVNVIGLWLCCKAAAPVMQKKGKGKIINIGSNVISCPPVVADHHMHYAAGKAAVYTMTQALARALGPSGINVNIIGPGLTASEGAMQQNGYNKQAWEVKAWGMIKDAQCIKRIGQPNDIAGTAVFLASDDSDFVTGQFIAVDGGTWLK